MKKKLLAILTVSAMVVFMEACGGSGTAAGDGTSTAADESTSTAADESASTTKDAGTSTPAKEDEPMTFSEDIRLLNGRPELDAQLQKLAAKYREETGNAVTIETVADGISVSEQLKGMYQEGNMPDIFVIEDSEVENWNGLLADLSDEAWTESTEFELTNETMGTIGFPYTVEATALAYNADVLEKAGVDPATLTSPSAWQAACETLDAQKDALGLTSVFGWCAKSSDLREASATNAFAQYLDAGLAYYDTTYIDLLNDGGQIDETRMLEFAEFVGMMNQYSDPALLADGTYDDQVGGFAAGKYAFVAQGSRISTAVTSSPDYSGFEMGFAPFAFEDGIDTIIVGPSDYWTVYSEGNVEAARAFLQWVSGDSAQEVLVSEAGLISPFRDCAFSGTDPFADSIRSFMDAGRISGWHIRMTMEGLETAVGQTFADFAGGTITDAQGFAEAIAQAAESCYAG